MTRPSRIYIDATALLHNLNCVKQYAPRQKIIAMVKANAYGCGLSTVVSVLDGYVNAFGVACIEEAYELRQKGSRADCILFQGVFSADELSAAVALNLQCVVHQNRQLQWILDMPLASKIKVWIKVDTGMHRLGFDPVEVPQVIKALKACPWIDDEIGVMTHFACADEPGHEYNQYQFEKMMALAYLNGNIVRSMANSAAIMALSKTHADAVRPGLMLYGVSPFANKTGSDLGLKPVMRLTSVISAIHHYPPNEPIGYGASWKSRASSVIGIIPVGYGDGYPRCIASNTPVWINGMTVPIVGRISMDMLTVDLTGCENAAIGDAVELWGIHVPVEVVAKSAGTIPYELLCQISSRVR